MTVHLTGSDDLNLESFRQVAWGGQSVELSAELLAQIGQWRAELLDLMEHMGDAPVYGVNVGAGDGSRQALDDSQRASYAAGLNSATSFGDALPERVVRGVTFARLGSFIDGSAAVTPELAAYVAKMLQGPLARVPMEATAGSGEILPLGHLFGRVPAEQALGPKESMALVNGAPCAAALTADIALRARSLISLAEPLLALAVDALNAPEGHFDPALALLWGEGAEAMALRTMAKLLDNAEVPRRLHQARVSVRIITRVVAATLDAVAYLEDVASQALRHPGDNPAFVPATSQAPARVISNGGFHNHRAIIAIDLATRTLADVVQLAQHLLHAIYQDPEVLPGQDNLALGISYMAAAGWSEDARLLATPSVLSFAAVGQNDVPNPLFAAWRKADRMERCMLGQLSILGATAQQSFFSTGRTPTEALSGTLSMIRSSFPPVHERRDVGVDLDHLFVALSESLQESCRKGHGTVGGLWPSTKACPSNMGVVA